MIRGGIFIDASLEVLVLVLQTGADILPVPGEKTVSLSADGAQTLAGEVVGNVYVDGVAVDGG